MEIKIADCWNIAYLNIYIYINYTPSNHDVMY